jgi:ribonuclease E
MTPTPRKSGIRLPWSQHEESDTAAPAEAGAEATTAPAASDAPATDTGSASEATGTAPAASTAEGAAGVAAQAPAADAAAAESPADDTDNALLASLITAMREVAERERESSVSTLRQSVDESVEGLRQRASEGAEQLRDRSESDIAAIGDWVKAETERITSEGERRRETRRQLLTQQLTDHEQRSGTEIESLYARIQDYERDLTTFFAQLHDINDPAAFGTAAKRMPRPPTISAGTAPTTPAPAAPSETAAGAPAETAPEADREPQTASSESEPMAAETSADATPAEASAEAAAAEGAAGTDETKADETKADDTADAASEPAAPGSSSIVPDTHDARLSALGIDRNGSDADAADEESAEGEAPATEVEAPSDPLRARLAELDEKIGGDAASEPATATVAAPGAAGEVATAIVVHGLGSFGAITSFKQSLERVDGVHGISLSLGPTGEFVYRATHEADFDLIAAIEHIEHGLAQIERQPDGSLRVVVQRGR